MNERPQPSTVSGWPELVSVALLGTERRDPPAPADPALAGLAFVLRSRLAPAPRAFTINLRRGK